MKKKIAAFALVCVMLCASAFTAFAANPKLLFDSSYDADTNTVSVAVSIQDAEGLEASDLMFAFDSKMFEYVSVDEADLDGLTVIAGKSIQEEGVCTCSLIFTEKCEKSHLDSDGKLNVAVFKLKPVSEDYNYDSFALWSTSFHTEGNVDINKSIEVVGNKASATGHYDAVTLGETQKNNADNANGAAANGENNNADEKTGDKSTVSTLSSRWYLYLIAAVLAVAAVAGIALIAVKNGQHGEDDKTDDSADENKSEQEIKADEDAEKTDGSDASEDEDK